MNTSSSARSPRKSASTLGAASKKASSTPKTPRKVKSPAEKTSKDKKLPAQTQEPALSKSAENAPLFTSLGLSASILKAIEEAGYVQPTEIQAQAIPSILMGRDVLGVAQTGTGKTASFTLPLLEILQGSRARARMPRSLILEPTRELALQVAKNFQHYGKYTKLTHALLIGGESMVEQKEVLNKGVDVLIATPGRLLDIFERGGLLLTQVRTLVIDEADRMLDMGFIPDVEKIVSILSSTRQTLLFSATMAPEIKNLADKFLFSPQEITVAAPSSVAHTIKTGAILINEKDKRKALFLLLQQKNLKSAIVFCNRKKDVDLLVKYLQQNKFSAEALHGDLAQSLRTKTLDSFRSGAIKMLVCSDIAARGIDVESVSHVFNYDLPRHAEDYVHRIGRTGRAGRTGYAYSLVTPQDKTIFEAIEKLTGQDIPFFSIPEVPSVKWQDDTPHKPVTKQIPEHKSSNVRPTHTPHEKRPLQENQRADKRPPQQRHEETQHEPIIGFGNLVPAFIQNRHHIKNLHTQPETADTASLEEKVDPSFEENPLSTSSSTGNKRRYYRRRKSSSS